MGFGLPIFDCRIETKEIQFEMSQSSLEPLIENPKSKIQNRKSLGPNLLDLSQGILGDENLVRY